MNTILICFVWIVSLGAPEQTLLKLLEWVAAEGGEFTHNLKLDTIEEKETTLIY